MAGSLTYRAYIDDAGNSYSIKIDESNAKAVVVPGNTALTLARFVASPAPSKGFKPRYCLAYSEANPQIKRKFYVGNALAVASILTVGSKIQSEDYPGVADTAGTVSVFVVTYYSGEKHRLIPAINTSGGDTGLTDGTPARDG